MRRLACLCLSAALAAATAACGEDASAPRAVRLLTHDSFVISDEARAAFAAATGLTIEVLQGGDAGSVVNQAILAAGNPVARRVKLADLEDNLDLRRLFAIGAKDLARIRRYHRAWRTLKSSAG